MARKGKGLALIFGGGPPEGEMSDEMEDEEEESPKGDFTELASKLFPDVDPEELRALIQACVEEGYDE